MNTRGMAEYPFILDGYYLDSDGYFRNATNGNGFLVHPLDDTSIPRYYCMVCQSNTIVPQVSVRYIDTECGPHENPRKKVIICENCFVCGGFDKKITWYKNEFDALVLKRQKFLSE